MIVSIGFIKQFWAWGWEVRQIHLLNAQVYGYMTYVGAIYSWKLHLYHFLVIDMVVPNDPTNKSKLTGVVNPLPPNNFTFPIKLYAIADFHIWMIAFLLIILCNWWIWQFVARYCLARTGMPLNSGIMIGSAGSLMCILMVWLKKAREIEIDPIDFKYKVVEHQDFSKVSI